MILCSVQLLQYVRNSWNVCYNKSLSTFLIKLRCKMGRSCVRISYWNNTLLEKKTVIGRSLTDTPLNVCRMLMITVVCAGILNKIVIVKVFNSLLYRKYIKFV